MITYEDACYESRGQPDSDYVVKHYRVMADGCSLEWHPCGPDCTHKPQKPVLVELVSAIVEVVEP